MSKQSVDSYHILWLRKDIEEAIGRGVRTPSDFNYLFLEIQKKLNYSPSISTLKRVWKYVSDSSSRSLTTLNTLSRFLGAADWSDYQARLMRSHRIESDFISVNTITTRNLEVGDLIECRWAPDRMMSAAYLGDNRFKIIEIKKSKLQVGAEFSCLIFSKGMQLVMTNLSLDGEMLGDYVAGREHGLTSLVHIPQ